MEIENDTLKKRIYDCLTKAYEWLFGSAIQSGNWREVRSSALAGLCLTLREPKGSQWLEHVKKWLLEQQVKTGCEDETSWGEELWDTCMALISLKHLGFSPRDPRFQSTLKWIRGLYNINGRNNWHDEPWETSWCILALLESEASHELSHDAYNAAKWLLSLQDEYGKIVSPHYTAYFLLIAHRLHVMEEDKGLFDSAVHKAVKYLFREVPEKTLWTGEAWSNGQILWALTSTGNFPRDNRSMLSRVVDWFAVSQQDGHWEDVEDTASSVLGLYYLLRELESENISNVTELDNNMFDALQRNLATPKLKIKRKLVETYEDGTTAINFSPKAKKAAKIIFAIVSAATVLIALWEFVIKLLIS